MITLHGALAVREVSQDSLPVDPRRCEQAVSPGSAIRRGRRKRLFDCVGDSVAVFRRTLLDKSLLTAFVTTEVTHTSIPWIKPIPCSAPRIPHVTNSERNPMHLCQFLLNRPPSVRKARRSSCADRTSMAFRNSSELTSSIPADGCWSFAQRGQSSSTIVAKRYPHPISRCSSTSKLYFCSLGG